MSPKAWRMFPLMLAVSAVLFVLFYFGAQILQFLLVNLIGVMR